MKIAWEYAMVMVAIITISLTRSVYADSFWPNADVLDCQFVHTLGLYTETSLLASQNILSVASVLQNNLLRYQGVSTEVHVKPSEVVSIGWFWSNYSGHPVTVKNLWIFFDSFDFLDISPQYAEVYYLENGLYKNVNGPAVSLGYQGVFQHDWPNLLSFGKRVFDVKIKEAVIVKDVRSECATGENHEMMTRVWGIVENKGSFVETVKIPKQEELTVSAGSLVPFYIEVQDRTIVDVEVVSSRKNCLKSPHALLISRNDAGNYYWSGAQYDIAIPDTERYCIVRDPYRLSISIPHCKQTTPVMVDVPQNVAVQAGEMVEVSFQIIGGDDSLLPEVSSAKQPKGCFEVESVVRDDLGRVVVTISAPTIVSLLCRAGDSMVIELGGNREYVSVVLLRDLLEIHVEIGDIEDCILPDNRVLLPMRVFLSGEEEAGEISIPLSVPAGIEVVQVRAGGAPRVFALSGGELKIYGKWVPGEYGIEVAILLKGNYSGILLVNTELIKVRCGGDSVVGYIPSPFVWPDYVHVAPLQASEAHQVSIRSVEGTEFAQENVFVWDLEGIRAYKGDNLSRFPNTGAEKLVGWNYTVVISCLLIASVFMMSKRNSLPKVKREK